jgi:hypothetical protein
MSGYASKIVAQARSWLGCKESDGSHKKIIDVYNGHKPLARGYAVKYTDAWCATFVSAVAIAVGYTDIIPTECGCGQMLDLFKKLGCWVESDSYKPGPGDIIFYDWEDTGAGDNTGYPDHVGIVESVSGNTITLIEGNYSNSVKRRSIAVNAKLIRGYGVPKYDKGTEEVKTEVKTEVKKEVKMVSVKLPQLYKGDKGDSVKAAQILLIGHGYSCGKHGADGSFGSDTDAAVRAFQKANGLVADGIVGPATWAKLLGV